ncbi:MAG TPA: hypothetical protein VF510_05225 [Ktedonobacterales bacterium]
MGTGDSRLSVPYACCYSTRTYFSNQPKISPHNLRTALDLLATGHVRVHDFITRLLPLARFTEGVARFTTRQARKGYFTLRDTVSK